MTPSQFQYDYLVIGSGIAGLFFALNIPASRRIAIVTKKNKTESNTNYAQGGIAAVMAKDDSFELHFRDTIEAGAGLCDETVVRRIIEEGPSRIQDLLAMGMRFSEWVPLSTSEDTPFDLAKEGGHSKRRILHAKDMTGRALEKTLLNAISNRPNIDLFEDFFAIDLITTQKLGESGPNRCIGAYILSLETHEVNVFSAAEIVLTSGGCGKVYLYTTNPDIATGDGVAMAYRAGATVSNMEFIQFHPTCLYHPDAKSFLISEAVRGEGGILKNLKGKAFMKDYHSRGSLASRDIVARAIDKEMKRSGDDHVHLDITDKPAKFIMERFPNIYRTCLRYGIDMTKESIPVVPAAHYQCGGVKTDLNGRTDIQGLSAIGEVACTGLHGANRLASNSLLEALVCSHRSAMATLENPSFDLSCEIPKWQSGNANDPDEIVVVSHNWDEVRRLMWDYVGIVRSNKRLQRAGTRIKNLLEEIDEYYWDFIVTTDLLELRNIATVAQVIIKSALSRPESRGLHFNLDYVESDPKLASIPTLLRKS